MLMMRMHFAGSHRATFPGDVEHVRVRFDVVVGVDGVVDGVVRPSEHREDQFRISIMVDGVRGRRFWQAERERTRGN